MPFLQADLGSAIGSGLTKTILFCKADGASLAPRAASIGSRTVPWEKARRQTEYVQSAAIEVFD